MIYWLLMRNKMAKKKAQKKDIDFGQDLYVSGQYVVESPTTVVPVSPIMDLMLNGGIKFGSFVIPTGPPKVGKTSFALDMAATALGIPTHFDNPRELYFYNIEGRINPRDLEGIHHLKQYLGDRVHIFTSKPGDIKTAENFLEAGEEAINTKPGCIFIFDSFSSLCSQEGKNKEWDGKAYRDNVPIFLSHFCKRVSNVVPINQSIVVGITHQIANTGFGFSSWAEASGTKIQYQVDVKLKATHKTEWIENDVQVGQDVHWKCFCSSLHNGPLETTEAISKLRYGWGLDKSAELANVCLDIGLIQRAGSWYTIGEHKVQGLPKVINILKEEPELYDKLNKEFREMMELPCA